MEHHDDQPGMDLPPGFRFHPTDEELITHYLAKKATDARFAARAIGEADLNKSEPWELPSRAKMGEKEWYFFCMKDRKYPTGLRTNRATVAGYWKATGKDKEIFRGKALVGMRKTLVFYMGRAPKGEKTNWVMHEYRLDGNFSTAYHLPEVAAKSDWVLCRVFKKSPDAVAVGKRGAAGTARPGPPITDDDIASCLLPPLMDVSGAGAAAAEPAHVTCFSEGQFLNVPPFLSSTHPNDSTDHLFAGMQYAQQQGAGGGGLVQLLESNGYDLITSKQLSNGERERLSASQDTGLTTDMNPEISSSGDLRQQLDHEALWGYIDQI